MTHVTAAVLSHWRRAASHIAGALTSRQKNGLTQALFNRFDKSSATNDVTAIDEALGVWADTQPGVRWPWWDAMSSEFDDLRTMPIAEPVPPNPIHADAPMPETWA